MNQTQRLVILMLASLALSSCISFSSDRTLRDLPRVNEKKDFPAVDTSDNTQIRAREAYQDFLRVAPTESFLRAEALRRLGDLEVEDADESLADEEALGQDRYGVAVDLYSAFLNDYPGHEETATVLYQLARAHESNGDAEAAQQALQQLVTEYPTAERSAEAWFRLGEMRFLRRDYRTAQSAYQSLIDLGDDSAFYDSGLYKLGWSMFKQAYYEEALDPFYQLLGRLLEDNTDLESYSAAKREMIDDSFRASSISFSYLEGADSIDRYFSADKNPAWVDMFYARLGDLYLEQERYNDAAETFSAYVARDPNADRAPLLQSRVIDAYQLGGFESQVLEAKEGFAERYKFPGPYWGERELINYPDVAEELKSHTSELAKHYHAQVQLKDPNAFGRAQYWYQNYLTAFPFEDETPNYHFLYAELLFANNDFELAAEAYEYTAYEYPEHEQSQEAGYAGLLARREYADKLNDPVLKEEAKLVSIDSALKFSEQFNNHPEAMRVLTTAAEELYSMGDLKRAVFAAESVVNQDVPQELAIEKTAWTVLANARFEGDEFAEAEVAYGHAISRSEGEQVTALNERLAATIYKQGEAARANDDLSTAVGHFQRVADVPVSSPIQAIALYDTATALLSLQDLTGATASFEAFRKQHPDHELGKEIPQILAASYLELGDNTRAANEYIRLSAEHPDPNVRRESLWTAAELYLPKQRNAAIKTYENIIARYPKPINDVIEAKQKLVDLYAEDNNREREGFWLNQIVLTDRQAGNERSDKTKLLAARASTQLAQPLIARYHQATLSIPLANSLKNKKALLEETLAELNRISDYGILETTTAATYETARAYTGLASALMTSERPKNLDALALEEYDILLEEQAFPFEEQAIDIHKINAGRTTSGEYNQWIKASFVELAKLMPVRYAKTESHEAYIQAID